MSESYKKRLVELEERGIDISNLLSDWCVDCIHSIKLVRNRKGDYEMCGTGCNGYPPFYTINGEKKFTENSRPLKYEKEAGTYVEM